MIGLCRIAHGGNASDADMADYRYLVSKPLRLLVERDFGVSVTTLPVREQFYLLNFLKTVTEHEVFAVQEFARRFNRDGLRTFLSLDHDRSMGDKILEFATSSVDEGIKKEIFTLYGKIIDAGSDASSTAVAEKIGKRAQQLLANAHTYKDDPEKLRETLQKLSVEGQVLLATFRTLAEQKQIESVAEVAGVEYKREKGQDVLANAEIQVLTETLYSSNYANKETQDVLIKEFRENLAKPGAILHRIQFGRKLVAMILLVPDKNDPKRLHVSALNVDKELVGVKAGPELLKKVLGLVQEGYTIEAKATFELAPQYAQQYGFHIGEKTKAQDGAWLFKLEIRTPSTAPSSTAPQRESGEGNK